MTKSELIERICARNREVDCAAARSAIYVLLRAVASALAAGNRVEIRDFGAFALRIQGPRVGRNPRTGKPVSIPRKSAPHFKMGKQLRERVNVNG